MDLLSEAQSVLQSAERSLKSLMETAIKDGRYVEVAQLAEMAQALGRVAGGKAEGPFGGEPPRDQAAETAPPIRYAVVKNSTKKSNSQAAEFPKFEREGDRLVKIGWSKKNKAAYEHKAPREVALNVCLGLAKVPASEPFRVEELLPMALLDGTEIPSYQAYLVLAWLRWLRLVEKLGKDSYQLVIDELNELSFQNAWDSTPLRGRPMREKRK